VVSIPKPWPEHPLVLAPLAARLQYLSQAFVSSDLSWAQPPSFYQFAKAKFSGFNLLTRKSIPGLPELILD